MKPSQSWWIWGSLVVCAAVMLGAMTWLSNHVKEAEAARLKSDARAALQERMRLALWRMDSLGSSLLIDETLRPSNSNGRLPVKMRFEIQPTGEITTALHGSMLQDLQKILEREGGIQVFVHAAGQSKPLQAQDASRMDPNLNEQFNRARVLENAIYQSLGRPSDARMVATRPYALWLGDELFLLHRSHDSIARTNAEIHAAWLDAEKLKSSLLGEITDLLPAADLTASDGVSDDGMVLASFPLRLVAGDPPVLPVAANRAVILSLWTGWIAALLAILTIFLLVRGVMRLSERRASFVSAVTHELRTPLTTFRLYSDMLESGVVKEEKRADYLRVLSREADRLAHLVENVLAFSRIERGSARASVRKLLVRDLLEPMRERFESRLATAGMKFEMNLPDDFSSTLVHVDAAAVEHILFNLIDNAAKYAAGSDPAVVQLTINLSAKKLEITVRDHGPGIRPEEHRRIFRPFHKSARDAAESRPGVGLGLALSLRLAKSIGGTLECEDEKSGARFLLRLPLE